MSGTIENDGVVDENGYLVLNGMLASSAEPVGEALDFLSEFREEWRHLPWNEYARIQNMMHTRCSICAKFTAFAHEILERIRFDETEALGIERLREIRNSIGELNKQIALAHDYISKIPAR